MSVCVPRCGCKEGYIQQYDGEISEGNPCIKEKECKTACQNEVSKLENNDLIGGFIPACDKDGKYSSIQIHGGTGYQWCAIVPEHSSNPLNENFKVQPWTLTEDQRDNFESACEKLQTSKCAEEIKMAVKESADFDFEETVKASENCQRMIDFCTSVF